MYTGSIIDELVRSVEMVEERIYTAPISGARRQYAGTQVYATRPYEFTYNERPAEVA